MKRPRIRMSGPIIDCADVPRLTLFYEELLGWKAKQIEGPGPGDPPEAGFTLLRSADGSAEMEVQFDNNYVAPTWPSVPGQQGQQIHLDFEVENLEAGIAWAKHCGASEAAYQPADRNLDRLRVMIDPAGHPWG